MAVFKESLRADISREKDLGALGNENVNRRTKIRDFDLTRFVQVYGVSVFFFVLGR